MFDKLKRAFFNAAKSISQKELTEKELDESLFDLQVALLESDVSQEVIDDLSLQIKNNLVGIKIQKNETTEQIIASTLKKNFRDILSKAGSIDLLELIQEKKQKKAGPFVIVFLGINGTGKTTTVAKVANLLKKNGFSVVIAAADTHRAGAIEQITAHADNLSIKIISQRYGADPSAVARDALEYAKKHYVDTVLIDTAGRMQTAKNLMYEIGKIVKVIKPDVKLFVGDSLSGNDTINQAREFFSYTEFDGAILTKSDADAKGGAAISISYITSKPIIYLGMGQGYDDLVLFDKEKFVNTVFSNDSLSISDDISSSSYKTEQNSVPYDPEEEMQTIKSFSKFSVAIGPNVDKSALDPIASDSIIKNEQKNTHETTDLTPKINSQPESKEYDRPYSNLNAESIDDVIPEGFEGDNDYQGKLEDGEEKNSNVENKSNSSGKKGLFGWFKKKTP
ncbi:MAG: signal recognition particle-docking protein FtsY [Nitrosopumilus sp.]|nr:signal recognition particle-docking protein FtsY [Nitrosopumilus sp.]